MDSQTTLNMIYEEVKKVNERLNMIEDVIEQVLIKGLSSVELGSEDMQEVEASIKEMKKGEFVTLEALRNA
jgi:hypothetical protein